MTRFGISAGAAASVCIQLLAGHGQISCELCPVNSVYSASGMFVQCEF